MFLLYMSEYYMNLNNYTKRFDIILQKYKIA